MTRTSRARAIGVCGAVIFQFAVLAAPMPAAAVVTVTSKVVHFPVRGMTAAAIYADVLRNAPRRWRGVAMATTRAAFSQEADLVSKSRCRLARFRLNVMITTHLPRLTGAKRMSPALRRSWNGFSRYVRRHENTHKSIYLRCARRIDARARRVVRKSRSCRRAKVALDRLFTRQIADCRKLHDGYDRREAPRIKRLPLITEANGWRRSGARSARRTSSHVHRGKRRR